jgi:hypothetical protein
MASISFRHQAWRDFEYALDPLGAPRALVEAKPSRGRDLEGSKTPFRRENESLPSESKAL